jgi:exopolysaccharide production protein ExoY
LVNSTEVMVARQASAAGGTSPLPEGARQAAVWPGFGKRVVDLLGATIGLLLLAPVLLMIALAVRWDGGPALYAHRRVGRGGKEFGCLKFRTMVPDADAVLAALLASSAEARAEWKATQKLRRDPRVTRVGRLLRATSLDELPQLFNVLRGEMSLVGPRPVVRAELDTFYGPSGAAHYMAVRPGITGLWQVSGRSGTSYAVRVALDVAYVSDMSLRQDVAILLRTLRVVLRRDGAY